MNVCHFCGPTTIKLTKEELWPKWLSKLFREMGIKTKYSALHINYSGQQSNWSPWNIDASVHGVCRTCNNETLSNLENKHFKPLLQRIIRERNVRLNIDDQATLMAWITRFVMVYDLQQVDRDGPFFSAGERKNFIDTFTPPEDTWIWLGVISSRIPAGTSLTIGRHTDGTVSLSCTGIVGFLAFQFLLRRWGEPRPSDETIARAMGPIIQAWAPATVQICPNVREAVLWPPRSHFVDRSFQKFTDRWGGDTGLFPYPPTSK